MAALDDEQWEQGYTLYNEGRLGEAVGAWHEALLLNPDHAASRHNLGVALYESGDAEAAIAEWRETVRRHPGHWRSHEGLGYTFWRRFREHDRRGDLQAARDAYAQALALRPDDAARLYNLGWMEGKLGHRQAAVAVLQRAIQADPSLQDAYFWLGRWQFQLGHWRAFWRTVWALAGLPDFDSTRFPTNYGRLFLCLVMAGLVFGGVAFVVRKTTGSDRD